MNNKFLICLLSAAAVFIVGYVYGSSIAWLLGSTLAIVLLWIACGALLITCIVELFKKHKENAINIAPFLMAVIAYAIVFTCKYSGYEVYGECLFNNKITTSNLYTKEGQTIVSTNGSVYNFEFSKHKDSKLYKSDVDLNGRVSGVAEAIGGPYFYYLKRVNIAQTDKGRDYDYINGDYRKKVYFDYEDYEITYTIAIYNSHGAYVKQYEESYYYQYYPNGKEIDGEKYSYSVDGEDISKYDVDDSLGDLICKDLFDCISELHEELGDTILIF